MSELQSAVCTMSATDIPCCGRGSSHWMSLEIGNIYASFFFSMSNSLWRNWLVGLDVLQEQGCLKYPVPLCETSVWHAHTDTWPSPPTQLLMIWYSLPYSGSWCSYISDSKISSKNLLGNGPLYGMFCRMFCFVLLSGLQNCCNVMQNASVTFAHLSDVYM